MATFSLERTAPLAPDAAWRRLTRWERHGDTVPLTRVTADPPGGPTRRGTLVVARTGVGPFAFADTMEMTVWQPPREDAPGLCRVFNCCGFDLACSLTSGLEHRVVRGHSPGDSPDRRTALA